MSARARAARARRLAARVPRWASIASGRPARGRVRVYFGHDWIPGRDELAYGGTVKFQALNDVFPNAARDFNVLYLGSSTVPEDARMLVRLARRRGAAVVWNQNGVAYPGWHGSGWERTNAPLAHCLHDADHVFFQSAFCNLASDRFLGERTGSSEVLHNPVDTKRFTPAPRPSRPLTLLLGGSQYQRYRVETALRTFAHVRGEHPDSRLLVAGAIRFAPDAVSVARSLVARLGIEDAVEFLGPYRQAQAPELFRRADVLVHTKYNDPCPGVVIEAMSCGLPVVYSASGGTAELVGPDAGVGVPAPLDWDRDHPPDPEQLSRGVLTVAARLAEYAHAARRRALDFDLEPWIERHRRVFDELVA